MESGQFLVTASSIDKAVLQAEHVAVLSEQGENLTPHLKTSIETEMHLEVYRRRPDAAAVVHAHPSHASLFTAMDIKLRTDILAEARFMLGEPVLAPYELMGTPLLAESVGNAFSDPSVFVVLMENHGVITLGNTLHQAYDRIEILEEAARMTILGTLMGGLKTLSPDQRREVDSLHG